MKVVFASYDRCDDIGGVSSWLQRFLPLLRDHGIDVEAHLFQIGGARGTNLAALGIAGIRCRIAPWPADTEQGTRQCWQWLNESQPDVYVPNCIIPAYFAAAFARQAGAFTVGVLHSDEAFYHGLIDEFVAGRDVWRLDAVVAVSSYLESVLRGSVGQYLVTARIPCGVPVPPAAEQPGRHPFRLIWTGRLVEEQKRASATAQALAAALDQWPDAEAIMIGDGSALPAVQAILAPHLASGRARLPGRQGPREIQAALSESDVFVLLSDYEGLPVSLLEAMGAGVVPVCLEMRSGIHDVLQHGQNGLIVSDRGADFLAAVGQLRNSPAWRAQLGDTARRTVADGFSIENCAASWISLLQAHAGPGRWRAGTSLPTRLHLPPPNAKFGRFDQRRGSFAQRLLRRFTS